MANGVNESFGKAVSQLEIDLANTPIDINIEPMNENNYYSK